MARGRAGSKYLLCTVLYLSNRLSSTIGGNREMGLSYTRRHKCTKFFHVSCHVFQDSIKCARK